MAFRFGLELDDAPPLSAITGACSSWAKMSSSDSSSMANGTRSIPWCFSSSLHCCSLQDCSVLVVLWKPVVILHCLSDRGNYWSKWYMIKFFDCSCFSGISWLKIKGWILYGIFQKGIASKLIGTAEKETLLELIKEDAHMEKERMLTFSIWSNLAESKFKS